MYVKNDHDEMVPYSAFMKIKKTQGPNEISRYNLYISSLINGVPAKGFSSGDAIEAIKEVAAKSLPRGYDIAWKDYHMTKQEEGMKLLYFIGSIFLCIFDISSTIREFLCYHLRCCFLYLQVYLDHFIA